MALNGKGKGTGKLGTGPYKTKQQKAVYWCGPELLDPREGLKNAGHCPVHQKFHGE